MLSDPMHVRCPCQGTLQSQNVNQWVPRDGAQVGAASEDDVSWYFSGVF